MFFTSFAFVAFFALLLAGYYTVFKRVQWQFLLLASLVFYAFSGWQNLLYILATILSTYFAGLQMNRLLAGQTLYLDKHGAALSKEEVRAHKAGVKKQRRRWLVLCLVFNFGILAVVKYTNFAIYNINNLLQALGSGSRLGFWGLLLPMGISFYTFQTMGYLIDTYRSKSETAAETNVFKLALFTSFFPQLIQGPISRHKNLSKTLYGPHSFKADDFSTGLTRVLFGFFKKLVVADRLLIAVRALSAAPEEYQGIYVVLNVLLYAVTLYADFTGGIDITIGAAKMLGIEVAENFDRPFYAKSIAEYWRRWHITMGTWFKDYLFYPLSVSAPMLKLQKKSRAVLGDAVGKRISVYLCNLIVWLATGLWHGASWSFIVWGLVNGVVLLASQELSPLYKKFHASVQLSNTKGWDVFQIFRTFWLMGFIRAFDIYADVGLTLRMVGSVFTNFSLGHMLQNGLAPLGLTVGDYVVAALGVGVMIMAGVVLRRRGKGPIQNVVPRYAVYVALLFAVLIFGVYGIGYDANQFIYNQF